MDLAFASKNLRHLCESQSRARRFFGDRLANKLKIRLADLEAASNFTELKAGNPRELPIQPQGQLALDLCDGYVIVVAAVSEWAQTTDAVVVDWNKVVRVKVLRIDKT